MIRVLYFTSQKEIRTDITPEEISQALQKPGGWLWVDISDEPTASADPLLREIFLFHPLAIEDALHDLHTPKIDDWDTYIYLVLHAAQKETKEAGFFSSTELDIFQGRNYLVTYQSRPIAAVRRVWEMYPGDERLHHRGPSFLLARLADELAFSYSPVVDYLEEMLDTVEDEIFDNPTREILERILQLKKASLKLVRLIGSQRDVVNKLGRSSYFVVDSEYQIFFRDVSDHLTQFYELSVSRRELVNSAMETYLSAVNNRMNDVMKTLAIFTALFLPLTFLTGFFGMNFFQPVFKAETWTGPLAFTVLFVIVLVVPVGMVIWMKRRGWF